MRLDGNAPSSAPPGSTSSTESTEAEPAPPPAADQKPKAARFARLARKRRPQDEEHSGGGGPPSGGPLALHASGSGKDKLGVEGVARAAERLLESLRVGRTREGFAEVRMSVGTGALAGSQMRLCARGGGIEATLIIPEDAARSGVELALAELTKVLKSRGVPISHCEVVTRDQQRQRDQREQRERQRSQFEAGGDPLA